MPTRTTYRAGDTLATLGTSSINRAVFARRRTPRFAQQEKLREVIDAMVQQFRRKAG